MSFLHSKILVHNKIIFCAHKCAWVNPVKTIGLEFYQLKHKRFYVKLNFTKSYFVKTAQY